MNKALSDVIRTDQVFQAQKQRLESKYDQLEEAEHKLLEEKLAAAKKQLVKINQASLTTDDPFDATDPQYQKELESKINSLDEKYTSKKNQAESYIVELITSELNTHQKPAN